MDERLPLAISILPIELKSMASIRVCPSGSDSGISSNRIRTPLIPEFDLLPKPLIEIRTSWFPYLDCKNIPGTEDNTSSTATFLSYLKLT